MIKVWSPFIASKDPQIGYKNQHRYPKSTCYSSAPN